MLSVSARSPSAVPLLSQNLNARHSAKRGRVAVSVMPATIERVILSGSSRNGYMKSSAFFRMSVV